MSFDYSSDCIYSCPISLQRRNDAPEEQQLALFRRSIRSVPGCGEQWAKFIRFLVGGVTVVLLVLATILTFSQEVNSDVVDEDKGEPISGK